MASWQIVGRAKKVEKFVFFCAVCCSRGQNKRKLA